MAPRVPAELKLEAPEYEEDIGDLSPYMSFPSSTSSRASSSTLSSSIAESHPRNTSTHDHDDDLDHDIPSSNNLFPGSVETPKKSTFSLPLPSPSSPFLAPPNVPKRPSQISRSHTLPRNFQLEKEQNVRPLNTEINALPVDPVSIAKMQRWILGDIQ